MATGFMFQISNKSAVTLTFASGDYTGTGDISPFSVTLAPGQTAAGATQNPGYYYFEQESINMPGSFSVSISAPGESASATLTAMMLLAPPASLSLDMSPVSVIQPANTVLTVGGTSITIGVSQTGSTGSHNWPVGTIEAV